MEISLGLGLKVVEEFKKQIEMNANKLSNKIIAEYS